MSSPTTHRIADVVVRLAVAGALLGGTVATTPGCAPKSAIRQARLAERQQDWDRAVVEYSIALRKSPGDQNVRLALDRAKQRATQGHVTKARRLSSTGRLEEALVELQIAQQLSPAATTIDTALRDVKATLRARVAVTRDGKTQLQTIIERARDIPSPGLDLPVDVKLPDSLIFRDANSRDVFTALARFAGINVIFDPMFRDAPVTVDLRKIGLEQALNALTTSTHNFYRVTAPRTVTVIPDTSTKRREYEEEVVRTFYLSNVDVKETIDLLRVVVDARRLAPIAGTNAITIKDTPERVEAAGRIIAAIDKARAEVVIDVEVLEVDRTRLHEYGVQVATADSSGIDGQASLSEDSLTLRDLRSLTSADVYLTSFPSLFYRLLKSDTSSRTLANPQLRAQDGVTAQARFGDRVPVPVTTFTTSTSASLTTPTTTYNYENIGVNIDITPRIHHDDDVSLALKVEVSSISGTGYDNLPTFGNRSVTTTIRLRDGETSVLAGLIRDDERKVVAGIPGLSDLPLVGRVFARNERKKQETDIIITLTPHIVRVLDVTEDDLRPFKVGRDVGSVDAPAIERPSLPAQPVKK
jgi:general secretion pathway protein D